MSVAWQEVAVTGDGPETRRVQVNGGWLYVVVTRYERAPRPNGVTDIEPVWSDPVFVADPSCAS